MADLRDKPLPANEEIEKQFHVQSTKDHPESSYLWQHKPASNNEKGCDNSGLFVGVRKSMPLQYSCAKNESAD